MSRQAEGAAQGLMDDDATAPLAVIDPEAPDPGDERVDFERPDPGRDLGPETDEEVTARTPDAVPRPPPPDRDLDLDHRLEPVDVRALEQADLDESHSPGRIATSITGERSGS